MTDLVSLLFTIDFKITNFSLPFFVIFDELASVTSATSNERMTTDIIFAGATPIN